MTDGRDTGIAGGTEPDTATARESRGVPHYEGTPRSELSPARPLHSTRSPFVPHGLERVGRGRAAFVVGWWWFLPTRLVKKREACGVNRAWRAARFPDGIGRGAERLRFTR